MRSSGFFGKRSSKGLLPRGASQGIAGERGPAALHQGPSPRFPRLSIFLVAAFRPAAEEQHRLTFYAHLDDGRRPTVATTEIHDHVDLTTVLQHQLVNMYL